jgi:hypothetical protein
MSRIHNEAARVTGNREVSILIRVGDGARGYLFFVLGLLSLQLALGKISGTLDYQGAIAATAAQPFGKFLLIIVLVGLVFYVLWALACALFDLLHVGNDAKGLFKRFVLLVNGIIYGLLIPTLFGYVSNGGAPTNSQNFNIGKLATTIFLLPFGKWIVAVIGVALIIGGLVTAYAGFGRDFDQEARSYSLSANQLLWARRLGRFGTVAYGTVIVIIGALFVAAFTQADPLKATGIDGALLSLIKLPFGRLLLGVIALGLISYGVYLTIKALWFRTLSTR